MNRKSALEILVVGCSGVGKTSYINQLTNSGPYPPFKNGKSYKVTPFTLETTGGPVHFNLRDHIERGDTHMLKHDPNINGVIFMYDVNRSGSFTWLLMRYEEYLKEKHAIIAFVGNDKAEDAWPPIRQISLQYAQEVADHWDTGSFHINAKHKIDLLLPMLYLARKILKLDELALVKPLPTGHMLPLPAPPLPPTLLRPPTPDYSTLKTTNKTYPLIGLAERIRRGVAKGYIVA